MKRLLLILVICVAQTYQSFGQGLSNTFYDEVWSVKVKQIDDFVDRFNNEINFLKNGSLVKNKFSPETRPKLLSSLVNYDKVKDQLLVEDFIQWIYKEEFFLQLGKDNIQCELNVDAFYKQKKFNLDLILKIEVLENGAMKWVISDAKSTSFPWKTIEQNPSKFINPSNHNLRFSNLFKLINEGNDIQGMFANDFELNNFSIIVHEIIEGNLEIKEIKKIDYRISIDEKFKFLVSYFDVPSTPSGWLISEIY
ncbi:hypothetical protein [Mongoliitalea lutea]|uniref:Uncharacterized protein n=1 Tax=Mongoliitalea lutea TaxID=849756 RepID=A0A8J3CWH5_9BACT|nr:hypothetical protein [Mongoliitalea lutea]GHB29414.1 hypothetical protein GCM10008106_07940 [Mongoliitalea lutea]